MEQFVVDAFADQIFEGNPAAVCVLDRWPEDALMLEIAKENNLSETAFSVPEADGYRLRWFTPSGEISLCGHATLATAYVITQFIQPQAQQVNFYTLSGLLPVWKRDDLLEMDFPAYTLTQLEVTPEITQALGVRPLEVWRGRDLLCIMETEADVRDMTPDMEKLKGLKGALTHVSAKGSEYDCVSRSFAPKMGVNEDPVCGSGHCHIIPYWSQRLGKQTLLARQVSARGGTLYCQLKGERMLMAGRAALYSRAQVMLGDRI